LLTDQSAPYRFNRLGGGQTFALGLERTARYSLPISALKSAAPVLGNPANHGRAISLTFEQFQFGWTNNLDAAEARQLYSAARPKSTPRTRTVGRFSPFPDHRPQQAGGGRHCPRFRQAIQLK
jgi:hypothetical protein